MQALHSRQPPVAGITAKELVGPLATDCYGYEAARKLGQSVASDERLVGKRLIQCTQHARGTFPYIGLGQHDLVVPGADKDGHRLGRLRLTRASTVVTNREGLELMSTVASGQCGDERRVDPPAQKDTEGDICDQP
nr:Unknown Function [uncultured bacterium]